MIQTDLKENTQVIFQAADSKTTEPGAGTLEKNMKVGQNTNVEMLVLYEWPP